MNPNWTAIHDTHGPALRRVCMSYFPAGADRDELVQEVMLEVWRALQRFRGECTVRAYVLRVAHNVALRRATRRRRDPTLEPIEFVDPGADTEQSAIQRQRSEQLMAAMRQLPSSQSQALSLWLEDLSHAEIAVVLGVSENAVTVRLHRAKSNLTQLLGATP